jgi:transcriptional regulator with XRE-family HTH domain
MRTSIQTVFGNHIRQLREQAGLTIEQLSEKSGFSSHRLCAIERGEINLNLGTTLILAMSMDTTLPDLFQWRCAEAAPSKLLCGSDHSLPPFSQGSTE